MIPTRRIQLRAKLPGLTIYDAHIGESRLRWRFRITHTKPDALHEASFVPQASV